LTFNKRGGPLDSPCFQPPTSVALWEYSGFASDFTNHKWCAKHYVGLMLPDGSIKRCDCPCHLVNP
jgi:hypothetical protein